MGAGRDGHHHEHDIGVAMIGPAIAVLFGRAPELGHRHHHDVLHTVSEVLAERGNRIGELI